MNALELLAELDRLGVAVALAGDKIRLGAPAGVVPPDLLETLRRHKPELVAMLKRKDAQSEGEKARNLLALQGWCAVKSHTLGGEIVVWANDGKVIIPTRWQNNVVYTVAELKALTADGGVTAEGLRQLHQAKKLFNGNICGNTKKDGDHGC